MIDHSKQGLDKSDHCQDSIKSLSKTYTLLNTTGRQNKQQQGGAFDLASKHSWVNLRRPPCIMSTRPKSLLVA